ncbi:hypothetical protein E4G67_00270 [Candidatus Bathyarchaeota archaeon]|nr:MAG: hypothetical protein E4G67_00270 [Candidatus Bathyarchaeota archaeon]
MTRNKIQILVPCSVMEQPKDMSKAMASITFPMQAKSDFVPSQQPDLLFMRSILVSTGENKNDDVFLPQEMWSARSTPVLKPVDWEHNTGRELTREEQIQNPGKVVVDNQTIGVMYNTYTIDEAGATINEADASVGNFQIPDKFHIVDEAVVWKGLYPSIAKRIEDGAAAGTLFVSMEAWFTDYNYLVGNKVVARNEETAFLDTSLRSNGGTGSYGSNRVRRVLRGITFGGKGIVARPANEPSVITHVSHEPISLAQASINHAIANNIICDIKDIKAGEQPRKEMDMSDNASNKAEQQVSLELYTQANSQVIDLRAEAKNRDSELATANSKVAELEATIANVTSAFSKGSLELESLLPGFTSKVTSGNPENFFGILAERLEQDGEVKAKLEKELSDALAKITQTELDTRTLAREAKIDSLLGIAAMPPWLMKKKDGEPADDEKAKKAKNKKDKMMAAIDGLNDEQFDALYEVWAEDKAEAEEMQRGSLPVAGGSEIGRGAQKGHPHGASGSETSTEQLVQEVLARLVPKAVASEKGQESEGSLGSLESFKAELSKGNGPTNVVQDIAKALSGHQELTDDENLSLILDKCVTASEQTPSAGEEVSQGVDLRQSFAGLVGKMLGHDDEEK